jgi:glycosyltransferase involved in cell wall biosynthesis
MTLPPIVYLGNDWFADNRTSSHHMARQLAKRTRVLYLEVPGLRAPHATARDIRRIGVKVGRAFGRRVEPIENLVVRTVLQLPSHGSKFARDLNTIASSAYASVAAHREGLSDPIVWCTVPHVAKFARRLRRSLLVYHCIDDYSALPGVNVSAIRALDEELSESADLVIAASKPVFEAKQRQNRSVLLMPHGVDVDHFARAQDETLTPPDDILTLRRPIVGFYGLIESWIDLQLVDYVAARIPHATFVMIGRTAVPPDQLPVRDNVLFLGPRPYESLPSYGRLFDVAIIPYKLTDQVIAANPLKLREYLAMGLPIVSVSTPEIDQFADVVNVTRSRDEFLGGVRAALERPRDPAQIARRMSAVADVSWQAKVNGLLDHVHTLLRDRTHTRVA